MEVPCPSPLSRALDFRKTQNICGFFLPLSLFYHLMGTTCAALMKQLEKLAPTPANSLRREYFSPQLPITFSLFCFRCELWHRLRVPELQFASWIP